LAFHSGREADHSPPSGAEVKDWVELYLHSPNTPSWRDAQLGGAQGQLCFTLLQLLYLVSIHFIFKQWHECIDGLLQPFSMLTVLMHFPTA
jgi:hypothetical protein